MAQTWPCKCGHVCRDRYEAVEHAYTHRQGRVAVRQPEEATPPMEPISAPPAWIVQQWAN